MQNRPQRKGAVEDAKCVAAAAGAEELAILTAYLPPEAIFVLCNPEILTDYAENYGQQISPGDPFHISWAELLAELSRRHLAVVELSDESLLPGAGESCRLAGRTVAGGSMPVLGSLDAFRPLSERAPEPGSVAEAQRREFLQQLHRWLRQGLALHVFAIIRGNGSGSRKSGGNPGWRRKERLNQMPRCTWDRWLAVSSARKPRWWW